MNIILDTGVLDAPPLQQVGVDNVDGEYNVSEPRIYPSDNDVIITVGPNQMAVVTAYFSEWTPADTAEVAVYKVLVTSGVPESGSAGCCPTTHSVPARKLRRAKLCGWELRDCRAVLVITTPGKYEFEPNSAGADVIITAQTSPLQEYNRGLDYSIR